MKRRVSVYLKAGSRAATSYYRFYQYFNSMDADFRYNLMIPESRSASFFPIARQPKWKQVYIFFYIYVRVLRNLVRDLVRKPDYLVISRCIINKVLPYSYVIILKFLKRRGCKLIWDFDDNIIGFEMSKHSFDCFSNIADVIIVGSPFLKEFVNEENRGKVILLPTTDGDMHHLLTEEIEDARFNELDSNIKIIWVGTFSTLHYVGRICAALEKAGGRLSKENKKLHFTVVCDKVLDYNPNHFELVNINWEKQTAIDQMLHSHIGIMPLEDNESTRGKCGFKLIQYLSVGLPIVGSTIGMNQLIINDTIGFGVKELDIDAWADAIIKISSDVEKWRSLSNNAFKEWKTKYSFSANYEKWKNEILC